MPTFLGFKLSRVHTPDYRWLTQRSIRTILDIGASKGKAVQNLRQIFPQAHIHAFEPLKDIFHHMQERLADDRNTTLYNLALGDTRGTAMINRSSYSGSSSLLPMNMLHKKLWPITAGERKEEIQIDTLDHIFAEKNLEKNILVVIDAQGTEDRIIAGGDKILSEASVVIVETSFAELYDGQPLFADIHAKLQNHGFSYTGSWAPELRSPEDGQPLQQDSIFIR